MKKASSYLTTIVTSIILFAGVPVLYAWTSPTGTPPANNVSAPINVGSSSQNKTGVLGLGGLAVFGKTLLTEVKGYSLPASKPTMLLGVNGAVGAKEYCDQNGNNCVTTLGGVSGGSTVSAGGQKIVCGGWDQKYGGSAISGAWGCATPASDPVCPSGYDTIKSSKVTINLAEQTTLCVLSNAGGGSSGGQIFSGWPNGIVCNATTGRKYVLRVTGYFPKGQERYSSKAGYIYGEIGGLISIFFDATTKKSLIAHGNGDYMNGGQIPQEYAPCFELGRTISDPTFTWID